MFTQHKVSQEYKNPENIEFSKVIDFLEKEGKLGNEEFANYMQKTMITSMMVFGLLIAMCFYTARYIIENTVNGLDINDNFSVAQKYQFLSRRNNLLSAMFFFSFISLIILFFYNLSQKRPSKTTEIIKLILVFTMYYSMLSCLFININLSIYILRNPKKQKELTDHIFTTISRQKFFELFQIVASDKSHQALYQGVIQDSIIITGFVVIGMSIATLLFFQLYKKQILSISVFSIIIFDIVISILLWCIFSLFDNRELIFAAQNSGKTDAAKQLQKQQRRLVLMLSIAGLAMAFVVFLWDNTVLFLMYNNSIGEVRESILIMSVTSNLIFIVRVFLEILSVISENASSTN